MANYRRISSEPIGIGEMYRTVVVCGGGMGWCAHQCLDSGKCLCAEGGVEHNITLIKKRV